MDSAYNVAGSFFSKKAKTDFNEKNCNGVF